MERILIVEDDKKIAQLERDYLESNGYETVLLEDGSQVIPELKANSYDLVLLDIMLPGCNGYDICRTVRDEIDIPILMVTARTEAVDVIRGLGLGADDYIEKPFSPGVLVARVKAHLAQYARLTEPSCTRHEISLGGLSINTDTRLVVVDGRSVELKNKEYELLHFLLAHPDMVFSREELYERI